jgi:hypothetical protein
VVWEVLHFFVSLLEVSAVFVSILVAGLMVAKVAFWILSRTLGLLAGRPRRPDLYEDEMDDYDDYIVVPTPPDDTA